MTTAPEVPDLDGEVLRCEIKNEYAEVAAHPDKGFHFHTGRTLAGILEYDDALLDAVPETAVESFAGTGNPFSLGTIRQGSKVVDVGSGAGIDSLIAANMVGAKGRVVGIDMTEEMLGRARRAAGEGDFDHVEFRQGYVEALPVDDGWADVVISNGVMNLCPDKVHAYKELNRVLKPGGRMQIADILVGKEVPMDAKRRIDLWTGWIAGALLEAELAAVIEAAGFEGFEITWRKDVFADAPQSSSAAAFGTVGINFRATKPA